MKLLIHLLQVGNVRYSLSRATTDQAEYAALILGLEVRTIQHILTMTTAIYSFTWLDWPFQ